MITLYYSHNNRIDVDIDESKDLSPLSRSYLARFEAVEETPGAIKAIVTQELRDESKQNLDLDTKIEIARCMHEALTYCLMTRDCEMSDEVFDEYQTARKCAACVWHKLHVFQDVRPCED